MMENTKAPGWLAMVEGGATSIWESYIKYDEDGHPLGHSMNHYSPGAVCAWLFDTVCGIRITGKNRFLIRPIPGGTLTHAKAEYLSPYGRITSGWEKEKDGIVFHVTIPSNCHARIELPDGTVREEKSGEYRYLISE